MVKLCVLADADSIHTRKWIDYFSELNYEIHLISMRKTHYRYSDNVKIYILKPPFNNKLSYFLLINKVKNIINKVKPDILHGHYATSYGMLGKMSGFHPFIVSAWGSDIYEFPNRNKLNEKMLKSILNSADAVCSTSNNMSLEMKKYYDGDIIITPFGVDLSKFKQTDSILNKDYITIGVAKNLKPIYGINYLIEAFSEVKNELKHLKFRLLIIGDGSERTKLEKLCEEKGVSSIVEFTGNIDNDKIPEYINLMDIVCIPSLSESFGVAAVEACACGRPVIASNVGGLKEIVINGYNGYLVKAADVNDIKEKIKLILSDRDKLIEFSNNARLFVEDNYNWSNNREIMKKLYDKFTNNKLCVNEN
ncbi:glycosyltransferase [Clostridium aestuarii]|uniref:Glycosyltransferase n=1 Tax=Clostridium aestuarii TaxID=338193 RepID=A0ABT4CX51_9CLOT|nr:glycosyltransferase [Clostridium aestuarii]